jgi:hypothetical protein
MIFKTMKIFLALLDRIRKLQLFQRDLLKMYRNIYLIIYGGPIQKYAQTSPSDNGASSIVCLIFIIDWLIGPP